MDEDIHVTENPNGGEPIDNEPAAAVSAVEPVAPAAIHAAPVTALPAANPATFTPSAAIHGAPRK